MGKTIEYWRKEWDIPPTSLMDGISYDMRDSCKQGIKTLEILASYANWNNSTLLPGPIVRLFEGKWNSHHAAAVEGVLRKYSFVSGTFVEKPEMAVDCILARLKKNIGNAPIDENGDLYKILQVIKEKTKVDYFTLSNPDQIIKKVENTIELERERVKRAREIQVRGSALTRENEMKVVEKPRARKRGSSF